MATVGVKGLKNIGAAWCTLINLGR